MALGRRTRIATQSAARPFKRRIHITVEGQETEINYLDGLKRLDSVTQQYVVAIKRGHGGTREKIAESAVDHKNVEESRDQGYDEYWCVFDTEGPLHAQSLVKALATLRKNGITPWLSNPSFEVWILAHFCRNASPFIDGSAALAALQKKWVPLFGHQYIKSDKQIFRKLESKLRTAVANAQWVLEKHHVANECSATTNSATDIGRLVKQLGGSK